MKREKNNPSSFTRKKLLKKIVFFLIISVFFTAFGTTLWFLRNGEFMRVTDFEISGMRMVPPGEVLSLIKGESGRRGGFLGIILPKDHRFAYLDNESLAKLAKEHFPRIKEISISWNYSARSISLNISERQESIIWCSTLAAAPESQQEKLLEIEQGKVLTKTPMISRKNCFWLDNEGLAIGEAPDSEGALVPVITDKSGKVVIPGKIAIPKEKLTNLMETKKMIRDFRWIAEETLIESPLLKEAAITISSGQDILISLERFPREEERLILDTIITEDKWSRVEYIDLRIEGKGFYKLTD